MINRMAISSESIALRILVAAEFVLLVPMVHIAALVTFDKSAAFTLPLWIVSLAVMAGIALLPRPYRMAIGAALALPLLILAALVVLGMSVVPFGLYALVYASTFIPPALFFLYALLTPEGKAGYVASVIGIIVELAYLWLV